MHHKEKKKKIITPTLGLFLLEVSRSAFLYNELCASVPWSCP
jgi:hypothetical protein